MNAPTPQPARRADSSRQLLHFLLLALPLAATFDARESAAATFYVEGPNAACSDAGAGTEAIPYCTIPAAVAAHFGPGVAIVVKPGVYPGTVTITKSGAAGDPFVLQAQGPGVVVEGSIGASGRSWITIDGFTVHATGSGISLGGCANVVVSHNTVTTTGSINVYGIYVTNGSSLLIASNTVSHCPNSGIQMRSLSSSIVEDNVSHDNATGFNFTTDFGASASGNNRIQRNRAYQNVGNGFYVQAQANGNLFLQNLAWMNGDHGIQHNASTGCRHIGDVVWGNADDGVSLRNGSTGTTFSNSIVCNNGHGLAAYEIYADTTSTSGFASDDNIIWRDWGNAPIRFGVPTYASLAAFASATGHDVRTLSVNPDFLDAWAGNFHLTQGSPAIDCGNSSVTDWPATDAAGLNRMDDTGTPNTGLGLVGYAERGAFEFAPTGAAPVALLQALPQSGHDYVLDASASYDPDGGALIKYWFEFGDGQTAGPGSVTSEAHTYAPGTWVAKVWAADASGLVSTASTTFAVGGTTDAPARRPSGLALAPIVPNPMRGVGRFSFSLPEPARVRIDVVDVHGRRLATLVDGWRAAGRHETEWNGHAGRGRVSPGVYFARLETSGARLTRRFVIER